MEKPKCTCTMTKDGHQNMCYYSKLRARARLDGREKRPDICCPKCPETRCQLNPASCSCHDQETVEHQAGYQSPLKTGLIWVPKSTHTPALNGPIDMTISQDIIGDAHNAAATACGAPTNLSKHEKKKRQRARQHAKKKNSRSGNAVIASLVDSSQEAAGEIDALKETIACILEDVPVEAPAMPEFHVPSGFARSLLQRLESDFQGYQIVADATDNRPMPLKRLYEKYCFDTLPGGHMETVVVGCNPQNNSVLRHHIQSSDDVGVDADCYCKPGTTCVSCERNRWVFVDTIHQWEPRLLALILAGENHPVMYSIQYEYKAVRGGLFVAPDCLPEIMWERNVDGIYCQDAAHQGKYFRRAADWMNSGGVRVDETTLCCKIVARVGDCVVYQLSIQDVPLLEMSSDDPLSDTYYGETTPDRVGSGDCLEVRLESIVGPIKRMYAAGEMLYCQVEEKEILIPKQAIGVIALWASGKARNSKLYADAYNQAINWLKTTRLTNLERADCIPYVVAFGLMRNVNTEFKAIGNLAQMSEEVLLHGDAISNPFAPPQSRQEIGLRCWYARNQRWLNPLFAVIGAAFAYGVAMFNKGKIIHTLTAILAIKDRLWPRSKPLSPVANAAAKISGWFMSPAKAKMIGRTVDHSFNGGLFEVLDFTAEMAGFVGYKTPLTTVVRLLQKLRKAKKSKAQLPLVGILLLLLSYIYEKIFGSRTKSAGKLIAYCARGRPLKKMRKGATCKIRHDELPKNATNADSVECKPVEGPFHVGLGIAQYIPVVASHCIHNDIVAVNNRGICERAGPHPGWWTSVGKATMFRIFDMGTVVPTERKIWISRYPGPKQKELEEAVNNTVEDYYAATRRKAFTKSECAVKRLSGLWQQYDEDDPRGPIAGYDPRLIQGCYPEYVNATGPFAHAFSKACKGEHGDTTYGPGLNAPQLDDWLDYAEQHFDEPLAYIDADAVRLDASVPVECIETVSDLYEKHGADDEAMRMFRADIKTHGATSCGVIYSVDGTVPSGKTTTTCGNTVAVITVVEESLATIKHKAIVAGDDSAIITPLRLANKAMDALLQGGKKAGFEFKVKASEYRYDMEFCSGRWWPADNQYGFAFGPKPGKLLPKLYFAVNKTSFGNNPYGYCKAVSQGIIETVSHLPVAREFVTRVYEITNNAKVSDKLQAKIARERMEHAKRTNSVGQSEEIWDAYQHIYGVGRYDCDQAIEEINSIEALPNLLEHWIYGSFVAADAPPEGDPPLRGKLGMGSLLSWFNTGLLWASPFLEERVRAKYPIWATLSYIGFEAFCWKKSTGTIAGYIPAACLHLYAMGLHLAGRPKTAMASHYLFNMTVGWFNSRRGRSASGNLFESFASASRPKSLTSVNTEQMSVQIALPQRQRQRRKAPKISVPPPLPARNTASYNRAVQQLMGFQAKKKKPRRNRRKGGNGNGRSRMSDPFSGREVINDAVPGVVLFGVTSYPANPGLATSFPILSVKASTWEKAHFNKLNYIYTTRTNQFQANGVGTVAMSFDYDAADAAPGSLAIALNSRPVIKGAPYKEFTLSVPCNQWTQTDYYNRSGPVPGDIKTYDCGTMHLCVDSTVNTNTIGILEVEYSGFFYDQVQPNTATAPVNNRVAWFESTASEAMVSTTALTFALATAAANGLGAANTAGSIVLPAGNYLVDASYTADNTSTSITAWTIDIQKNTVSIFTAVPAGQESASDSVEISAPSAFVSSNGSDAFRLQGNITFGAGTGSGIASMRFVSV